MDMKNGPITKALEDNDMVSYLEEGLKRKIEGVLVLGSIDARSSSLCGWGFEALDSSRRKSQTLETTSRPLSYNNLKLPLICGTFVSYDYEAWEQKVESLFYCYCVREEEKFQLVLKSLSYEVNVCWDCKCENRRRMGVQPFKTWSLMKRSLRNRFGVGNHEGQKQGQAKGKIMESSMGEKSTKANKLSQAQDVLDRKVIHHDKKKICIFVKEENSREKKVKTVVSTKESEGKKEESECLIENQDEIEKSRETKEEMILMIF
ncbi:hypothetical protein M9H77_06861 [Catharanthus roseus]|uniref:Uncharacterized protein n=1 Tax=Catharanthus roseus TaxID=4058 RepID=A0ACC0BTI6_CATRO|nr:hypothetical protein M9H77_06861 [Catharanthus roseus]